MRQYQLVFVCALVAGGIGDALAQAPGSGAERAESPKNTIYLEGGGGAVGFPLPSVNYERVMSAISVRAGLAVQPDSYNGVTLFAVPLTVSWIGLKSASGVHQLELGVGALILANQRSDSYEGYGDWFGFDGSFCDDCEPGTTDTTIGVHGVIGYRMQLARFQLRAGLSPALLFGRVLPVPHLSFGYSF